MLVKQAVFTDDYVIPVFTHFNRHLDSEITVGPCYYLCWSVFTVTVGPCSTYPTKGYVGKTACLWDVLVIPVLSDSNQQPIILKERIFDVCVLSFKNT